MNRFLLPFVAALSVLPALHGDFVPEPTLVTLSGGDFSYDSGSRIFYETRSTGRAIENTLQPLADVLAGELEILTGIKPAVVENTGGSSPVAGDISLEFDAISGTFAVSEEDEDQSYTLEVADAVTIRSEYYKGVAYGTTTLLQAIVEDSGAFKIPRMSVADTPATAYRAVEIDVARQPSSIATLKEVVRLARQYKVRYVLLHLTDNQNFTFPFTPVTDNVTNNFTYTRAELIDLVAYADARGVTMVPEFDVPGHSAVLRASGYLNPTASDYDVADPANYDEIQAIIDDILSVFVSTPYFHIGGDESGAGDRLVPFLAAMNNHLRGTPTGGKRRMLVWEGFHGAPTSELPPTGDDRIIVIAWESSYNTPWNLLNAGYHVVNAMWNPLYLVGSGSTYLYIHIAQRLWPREDFHSWNKDTFKHWGPGYPVFDDSGPSDPITDDHTWDANYIGRQNQVVGGQMTYWETNEKTVVRNLLPRLPAMADRLWNPQNSEDLSSFTSRLDAAHEIIIPIVRPVEILPLSEDPDSPINEDYRVYTGGDVTLTMRNRTKIPGTIRYETAGFSNDRTVSHFADVPQPTASSSAYSGPFTRSGGFGIRAQLYRQDDGTLVDGNDWQHFNNWDNRVRVTEYRIPRIPLTEVPDFETYPAEDVLSVHEMPVLRGPYVQIFPRGLKYDAILKVPGTGDFQITGGAGGGGHAALYLDLDQDGSWDTGEKFVITDGQQIPLSLTQGDYRMRVDFASDVISPIVVFQIDGPGTGGSKDFTEFLALPGDPDAPSPDPMTWVTEPSLSGDTTAAMECSAATHPDGVEYYFEETSGNPGGDDSGWQSDTTYTDTGLQEGYTYTYRAKARNLSATKNETEWSFPTSITLASLAPAELISVDINNSLRATVVTDLGTDHYIGDLKDAGQNATDDQIGIWDNGAAAANWWNYGNFSASNLREAAGSITGVSYTISNTTNAASDWTAGTPFDDLVVDGVFQVAGNPITTTVSGLGIGARYNVLVYHADNYVTETVTVNGQAASDHTGAVANPGYTDAFDGLADSDFWYFADVEANGSGELVISSDSSSGFFTLTGFQLELIPESPDPPSAATLVSPADVATGVSTFSALAWSAGAGATSYGVYLWETSGTALTPSDPPTATVSALSYDPGVLNPSTGYSWFIKAINDNGETPSSTWTFTTDSGAPLAPNLTGPGDGATNQSVFTLLEWEAATGADSYEVFLWKSSDAMPVTATWTGTDLTYDPVQLDALTEYSWLVKSVNGFGSTPSDTYTFTTGDAPPASTFDVLFNVDWGKNVPDSFVQSGAGAIGSAGDVWNATDPEANVLADLENIVDSTGAPSTVDVTWSDELESIVYTGPIEFGAALNPLMEDYAFTHPDTTATVTISGLAPNADYTLYLLGVSNDALQDSTFSVTGSSEGTPQTVTSPDTVGGPVLVTPDDYVVFTGNTGASSEIVYTVTGGANFCAHNGLQLGLDLGATGTSYASWAAANGASADPSEDSNNNGVANGIEFFMGGTQEVPATMPPVVSDGGTWKWTIPYDPVALANWKFQTSEDLGTWGDYVEADSEVQVLSAPDRIEFSLPVPVGAARMFTRLVVTAD